MSFNILPESATAPPAARRRYFWRSLICSGVVAISLIALLEAWVPPALHGPAFALLAAGLLAGAYEFARLILALDEMQQRIHTSALALAGGLVTSFATLWGLAAQMFEISTPNAVFAGPAFVAAYYAALIFVARRFT
ncbi:hypothetical protein ACWCOP_12510 [Maricaulaceae bacterium MS644]